MKLVYELEATEKIAVVDAAIKKGWKKGETTTITDILEGEDRSDSEETRDG